MSSEINASAAGALLARGDSDDAAYAALVTATCKALGATGTNFASLGDDAVPPSSTHITLGRRTGKTSAIGKLAAALLGNTGAAFSNAASTCVVALSREHALEITMCIIRNAHLQASAITMFVPSTTDYVVRFVCGSAGTTCMVVAQDCGELVHNGLANAKLVLVEEPTLLEERVRAHIAALAVPCISIGL